MKSFSTMHSLVLSAVIGLLLAPISVNTAMAGVEPSPFRPETGVQRLNLVEGYALTAQQMVTTLLEPPPDDSLPCGGPPPDDGKTIRAVNRLTRQIGLLERLMVLSSKDVIAYYGGNPPDDNSPPPDDNLPVINELAAIAGHAELMMLRIGSFLAHPPDPCSPVATPPDPCSPEYLEALRSLLGASAGLYDTAMIIIDKMTLVDVPR